MQCHRPALLIFLKFGCELSKGDAERRARLVNVGAFRGGETNVQPSLCTFVGNVGGQADLDAQHEFRVVLYGLCGRFVANLGMAKQMGRLRLTSAEKR